MVYIQNKDGQPLMPTSNHAKVRILLKQGKAKVVNRTPFTIRLNYTTPDNIQPVTVGVDAGYKHIGVCASTESKVLYQAEVEERTDIVKLLKNRRVLRRSRRSRNTRYRQARFNNRIHSKHKGWLAPSVEHKIDTHITVIKNLMEILPIAKIRIETAEFDIHKLKNPDVQGIDYQYGEKYGHYNTRNYILWRDSHSCRCCGKNHKYLYVVSADRKDTVASEDLYTVCKPCLDKHLSGEKPLNFKKKRHFAPPTQMGIMRDTLLKRMKEKFDVPIEQTYGYITKGVRNKYNIPKSHINDAYCIAGNMSAKPLEEYYYQRKIRRHNRQIHKTNILKGGIHKLNQAPYKVNGYRLFDKVKYGNAEYFIFARRKSGYFDIRNLTGDKVNKGSISYKKLRFIEETRGYLTERRTLAPPTT